MIVVENSCALRTRNVGKRYENRWIFRGLDIDLFPGQCLAVLGSNGSGKSTLLKVLSGLNPPSEGTVESGRVGYFALDLAVYPGLTGREHLDLALELAPEPLSIDSAEPLRRIGLENAIDQPAGQYSSGMRARLKLALATAKPCDLLILDEPSASLDEAGIALVGQVIAEQLKTGAVVLATNQPDDLKWSTHELRLA